MPSGNSSVCVFVCSSDRTLDVFDRVFGHFADVWPDCPYPCFVGLTSSHEPGQLHGFTIIAADGESGWRQELAEQLAKLPQGVCRVLLLLDDFLVLGKINTPHVAACVLHAQDTDMAYLRLKPLERSWIGSFIRLFKPMTITEKLKSTTPYYSSVQAALWKKEHLLRCLAPPGSIWQFEHLVPPQAHWAVATAALPYRHVVEKGRWMADAPALFRQLGLPFNPGSRASWPWRASLWWRLSRIKFGLIGYSGTKTKRWLRSQASKIN